MAQKISDLNTVMTAALNMLAIKKISTADQEFAMSAQLWVYEARLEFAAAFKIAQKMRFTDLRPDAKLLKLALLAELSGHDPRAYYQNFLKLTRNQAQAASVYAKMIHESSHPWKMLATFKSQLKKSPEIYGATVLEAFSKARDLNELKKYTNDRALVRSSSFATLKRYLILDSDKKIDHDFLLSRISTQSDAATQSTLKHRLSLLKLAEQRANAALRSNDFTLEVVSLHRVAEQNTRLYNELLNLPVPRHLKPKERKQYSQLLRERAAPFKATAETAGQKLDSLWAQSGAVAQLMELSQSESGGARQLLISDLNLLMKFAKGGQARDIETALAQAHHTPSRNEIEQARKAVRAEPFDIEKLEALKRLEARRDAVPMVVFLEARLASLNQKTVAQKVSR
jgi:hypothetical protein